MNEIKKALGKKIKYYREKNGLTQEKLAEIIEVNTRSLSFIECGINFITADTLDKLCKAFRITPKQLFDIKYYPQKPENIKAEIINIINENEDKLYEIYKIIKGYID